MGTFKRFDSTARVLIVLVNIVQIVVVFAIAYRFCLGEPVNTAFDNAPAVQSPFDHLFLSWMSLPPLGSGYLAKSAAARALTMAETGSALLLVVIALSAFVSKATDAK